MLTKTDKQLNNVFDVDDGDIIDGTNMVTIYDEKPSGDLVPYEPESDDKEREKQEDEAIRRDMTDDYETARENLRNIIDKGNDLLDLAVAIAQSTEDSKSIDAASKVLQQMTVINGHLLELTQRKQAVLMKTRVKDIVKKETGNNTANVTNNTQDNTVTNNVTNNIVFSGTTTDLAKLIADMSKGE